MNRPDVIRLELPPQSNNSNVLCESIQAVLVRQRGLADREQTVELIHKAVQSAWLQTDTSNHTRCLPVTLTVYPEPSHLTVELDDFWQQSFDLPMTTSSTNGSAESIPTDVDAGLNIGVYLMRQLMDEVSYTPQPGHNTWRLIKHLPTTGSPESVDETTLVRLDLPASYKYLNVIGENLRVILAQIESLDRPAETSFEVQLAVQEACNNIVDHAYKGISDGRIKIVISLAAEPLRLVIELHDSAPHVFDISAVPDPAFAGQATGSGLLTGSALLMISATVVNAGNYLFNLILGRWLGPVAFADLSLIVTLMLMVTLVTATYQTVAAKFAAAYTATGTLSQLVGLRRWLTRSSWLLGGAVTAVFILGAPLWQQFFHTASIWPFIILGLGLPMYFGQGVDRGILQGQTHFGLLAVSYQAEMWVRLAAGIALVALGFSVNGAIAGVTLSFIATWLIARQVMTSLPSQGALAQDQRQTIQTFAGPVIAALIGQILINNSDILIVKRFFPAEAAGQYAALALIGRIVFFATWSVVTVLFPVVAQKQQKGEPHRYLLGISLGLVVVVSGVIIGMTIALPELIVTLLFGSAYLPIAKLLWLYGVATMLYALSNVVISYRLSIGHGGGSMLAVLGGLGQVVGLWFFHGSLLQVVLVQIYIMSALLAALLSWDAWLTIKAKVGKA